MADGTFSVYAIPERITLVVNGYVVEFTTDECQALILALCKATTKVIEGKSITHDFLSFMRLTGEKPS